MAQIGPCAFLVRDDDLYQGFKSTFIDYLIENGFTYWNNHGFYEGSNYMFININTKIFAFGMPGIKLTYVIGDHAIKIDEFKSIYGTFKQYQNLKPLEYKKIK